MERRSRNLLALVAALAVAGGCSSLGRRAPEAPGATAEPDDAHSHRHDDVRPDEAPKPALYHPAATPAAEPTPATATPPATPAPAPIRGLKAEPRPTPVPAPPAEPSARPAPEATKPGDTDDPAAKRRGPVAESPHTKRPHADEPGPAAPVATAPRVRLPASPAAAQGPALPERVLVAVAFVRQGRLARDDEELRRLAAALETEACVKNVIAQPGIEGAAEDVGLEELARAAGREGARLVVVDARPARGEEGGSELLVVEAPTGTVVAYRRGAVPAEMGAGAGTVERIVARLAAR